MKKNRLNSTLSSNHSDRLSLESSRLSRKPSDSDLKRPRILLTRQPNRS